MIWFIIFPLVFFAAAYYINRNDGYRPSLLRSIGCGLVWMVVGLLPALIVGLLITVVLPHEERVTGQLEIVALADATHTDGDFYLFGGSIDSEPVYRYYYRSDGGYRMGWKLVEDSLIIESETETPRYDKVEDVRDLTWYSLDNRQGTRYVFYVPPGTVTNDFSLDLEG